jgi:non-ribosomal peptide synthetase component E (peptide arylation enzyme)
LTQQDVALAISPPSLDVSLIELLAPLSASGCVVILDDDVALDSERLSEAVGRSATLMMAPTSVWADLLAIDGVTWPRLKAVCFGAVPGRAVSSELGARTAAAWFGHGAASGPIWTTLCRLVDQDSGAVLGKPLAHVALRVVDTAERDVPVGVTGELVVRVATENNAPWVRTGHQTRWRSDYTLELVLPRLHEAYVDGFRINLDDVAGAIRGHAAVGDAEVFIETAALPERLIAWVVPRDGSGYSVAELRRELRRSLPAAMVPRSFVEVESIPRSADGRVVLGMLEANAGRREADVLPETPTERMLAELWSEALSVDRIGVHDNFFALGGYSLLCFQVLERIERETGRRVSPRLLLLDSLRQVAAQIDGLTSERDQNGRPSQHRAGSGLLKRLSRFVPRSA